MARGARPSTSLRTNRVLAWLLVLVLTFCAALPAQAAGLPRVRLETSLGTIVVELDTRRAPVTAGNFLKYVEEKRFDRTSFYRAARNRGDPTRGLVQGGINHTIQRSRMPIAHEPTSKTGLKHRDGTISMARNAPGTAMGDFFITIGDMPYLDAAAGKPGYAAFGRVVSGMAVVKKILALPTFPGGWSRTTMQQSIRDAPRIITARRI